MANEDVLLRAAHELLAFIGDKAPGAEVIVVLRDGDGTQLRVCTSFATRAAMRGALAEVIAESVLAEGGSLADVSEIAVADHQALYGAKAEPLTPEAQTKP